MANVFQARFHGRCAECDQSIDPGDYVRYNSFDELLHDDCWVDDGDDEDGTTFTP